MAADSAADADANVDAVTGSDAPRKPFGLGTATFVVIASMVGTGVLTTSGFTVYATGSNAVMLVLWIAGGILAVCGALTLCELTASLPRSGGDYIYLLEAFGRVPAFLSGWVSFLIGFGGPIAVSAAASAQYLVEPFAPDPHQTYWLRKALASGLIVALAAVHASGHAPSRRAQGATTITKLCVLGLLAAAGIAAGSGRWSNLADFGRARWNQMGQMFSSLIYINYAYTGWNGAAYVAGEVNRPQRNLPRAILLGTGVVTLLYLALNTFYALALPAADVRAIVEPPGGEVDPNRVAPIAWISAQRLFGERVGVALSLAVGVTLIASVSAYVLTGPRVACAMAQAGQFPSIAARLSPRTGAPALATWIQAGWALVLLWVAAFESVITYAGVGLALFSILAVGSVFRLRRLRPDLPRPFLTPGYPWTPIVFLTGTGALTAAVFAARPLESTLALASILGGVPIYYLWQSSSRWWPPGRKASPHA